MEAHSGGLLHGLLPCDVQDGPASRVRPVGVGDARPGYVRAQGFAKRGAPRGALDGRAPLGGNAAVAVCVRGRRADAGHACDGGSAAEGVDEL